MAWTVQYYHEFYDTNDALCRVDILKDAAALNIELEGEPSPFKIIHPAISDKIQPVRGAGCELNLYSATDRQLEDLFTADMMQYRIKYAVAAATTWFGYLDSEQYSESYSEATDYPLQFTGNNGLGGLDKIKFLNSGAKFTGLATQWNIISAILLMWGLLEYVTAIKVYLSTTSSVITIGATETLLHKTYVNCGNYYDEDNEPMTCRQVLEAILAPYGAFITVVGSEILITDLNTLGTDAGFTWKVFDNAFTYDTTEASEAIGDLETIGYYQTGAKLDMIGGRNKQVIRYSKYAIDELVDNLQDEEGYTPTPNFVLQSPPGSTYYEAANMTGLTGWVPSPLLGIRGFKQLVTDNPEYNIHIINPNTSLPIVDNYAAATLGSYTWGNPYVIGSNKFYLKISGLMRVMTRTNPYEKGTEGDDAFFRRCRVLMRVFVGNQVYGAENESWHVPGSPYTVNDQMYFWIGESVDSCNNRWMPIHTHMSFIQGRPNSEDAIYISLEDGVVGNVKIELAQMMEAYNGFIKQDDETIKIHYVNLKDIKIELVTNPGLKEVSSEDLEYKGEIIPGWKDEGSEITLYHGNSAVGSSFDNGALVYFDTVYKFLPTWTRGGETNTIEKLLLATVQSNYETKTTELSVKINNSTHIPFQRIKDTTYLSGQMLMFAGGTIDCVNNSMECSLVEIKPDNLTIS